MTDSASTSQLDYAPAPPGRRKWLWRAALVLLVAAVSLASLRWGSPAWRQLQILYWQRQCMEYRQPADTVVYEEQPSAAAALLATGVGYTPYLLQRGGPGTSSVAITSAASHGPRCLGYFITESVARGTGGVWGEIIDGSRPAVAFLHERTSPSGHARLVFISYYPGVHTFISKFSAMEDYLSEVFTPASLSTSPQCAPQPLNYEDVKKTRPQHPPLVRMYAGQPDPADPSHFTIRYQMWGQEDVLDGKLNDDDTVTLIPRHTPQEPK